VQAGEVIVLTGVDIENTPVYYLSLGTSLAAGVQADPVTGKNVVTDIHYPGLLAEIIGVDISKLRHKNLGCPGETSDTFMDGGRCDYPHGSQLEEAVNFLQAHGKFTGLITIDLGANDVLQCTQGTIAPAIEWLYNDHWQFTLRANWKWDDGVSDWDDNRSAIPYPGLSYALTGGATGALAGTPSNGSLRGANPLGRFRDGPIGMAQMEDEIQLTIRYRF